MKVAYQQTDYGSIYHGDCIEIMASMKKASVDLCLFSPPYEDARTYGIDFKLKGEDWVEWMVKVMEACLRVTKGLVACVCEGKTRNYKYSCVPILLAADLHRAGVCLRKPPIFHRVGIPGTGGTKDDHSDEGGSADWLRNDYEFIICATNGGPLPWADTLAMGHRPKWGPGGVMTNRTKKGMRVNQWGGTSGGTATKKDGTRETRKHKPSHVIGVAIPAIANPGNVISLKVGGGLMGSDLAHENEAPFPESLANFFIRSFCPPGGAVLDCFSGSGTTAAVAVRTKRRFIAIDVRKSQIELTKKRVNEAIRNKGFQL